MRESASKGFFWERLSSCVKEGGYDKEKEYAGLHELDEAVTIMVNLFENDECVISSALQYHQDGDVDLHNILSLRIAAIAFSLVFACNEIVELFEGVECGLLTPIGHVLADTEVWLIGVDVGGVGGQGTTSKEWYFRAYLYLPALKNWYACSIN